jgi:hypothetical protein
MTRTRLEALQWYGLFAGALAWTTQHVVGYFLSDATCSASLSHNAAWELGVAAGAGVVILSAEAAAFLVYRATGGTHRDAPGPEGRLRFLALAALLGNLLFLVIVVLDGVGTVVQLPRTGS